MELIIPHWGAKSEELVHFLNKSNNKYTSIKLAFKNFKEKELLETLL